MKKIFAALLIAGATLFSASLYSQGGKVIVVKSDGKADESLATKTYKFSSLTGVKAGSVFEITATDDNRGKVTISAPAKTLEHVIVSESGGVLTLRIENGYSFGGTRWPSRSKNLKGPVKVTVGLSALRVIDLSGAATLNVKDNYSEKSCDIDISGASKVRLSKLSADRLNIDASGAAELVSTGNCGFMNIDASGASKLFLTYSIDELKADISGASKLNIKGVADKTVMECSGASNFEGDSFQTKTAKVELSGAAKTEIGVKKEISGEVSGASTLKYIGDPDKVILERSRGASVSRKAKENKPTASSATAPMFKGKPFKQAVAQYFEDNGLYGWHSDRTNRNTDYYPEVLFKINADGSLKEASIVKSTGNNDLDNKLINQCRNLIRKKHITPSYSGDEAVPCEVIVPIHFKDNNYLQAGNKNLRYTDPGYRGITSGQRRPEPYNKYGGKYTPKTN